MIKVKSEIGKLKSVLLHRPGKELENLTPQLLEKLLFDDIPYLKGAQEEHDLFAEALRNEGVEVLYLTDMITEALEDNKEVKSDFINSFIEESKVRSTTLKTALYKYFSSLETNEMILKMIEGVRKHDVEVSKKDSIMDLLEDEYPFYTDPIPNILFQRDPFSSIGYGVAVSKMATEARQRETLFADYILRYHKRFKDLKPPRYYNRLNRYPLEGGDVLVLNEKVLALGISKRTDPRAIEYLAENIFKDNNAFETILAFNIPKTRAFMHLDTVFTQVNQNLFTIHPGIKETLTVFEIRKNKDGIKVEKVVDSVEAILEKHLNNHISLIHCGGEDIITSVREQWNDGANTLAVSPNKVIVYNRNHVTNQLLRDAGVEVIEIQSSELSRGRGGPRCMSMPLEREEI